MSTVHDDPNEPDDVFDEAEAWKPLQAWKSDPI